MSITLALEGQEYNSILQGSINDDHSLINGLNNISDDFEMVPEELTPIFPPAIESTVLHEHEIVSIDREALSQANLAILDSVRNIAIENTILARNEEYGTLQIASLKDKALAILETLKQKILGYKQYLEGYIWKSQLDQELTIPEKYVDTVQRLVCKGDRLRTQDMQAICENFRQNRTDNFNIKYEGLTGDCYNLKDRDPYSMAQNVLKEQSIPEGIYKAKSLLFLPFSYPGHVVLICIDFKQQTVEYYDPTGCESEKAPHQYANFNMRNELKRIQELCFSDVDLNGASIILKASQIKENREVHQEDVHNCGVYVCNYIEKKINGGTFDEITSSKPSLEIEALRIKYAMELCQNKEEMMSPCEINEIDEDIFNEDISNNE